jgi:hypothetical protein
MAIDTPTTTLKPNVDRLRAEALDLAERCGRSTDAREQFRLSEQALALWQLRALDGRRVMTRGPKPILARHLACVLQRDPTSTALRELEGRAADDIEVAWTVVHELDLLATRSARWATRLASRARSRWGQAMSTLCLVMLGLWASPIVIGAGLALWLIVARALRRAVRS